MEKSQNRFTAISLLLTTVGVLLISHKPPFYIDIVILCAALIFGIIGYKKSDN